jgi:hypothetical protein
MDATEITHDEMLNRLAGRRREHAAQLADANTARARAEQERDAMRLCSVSVTRTAEMLKQERDQAHERAANMAVDLAAMTLSRDQARQDADLLRRQVEALCGRLKLLGCPHDLTCKHDCNCVTCWREWAAQQAKEGGR